MRHRVWTGAGVLVLVLVIGAVLGGGTAASAAEPNPPKTCWVDLTTGDSLCVDTRTDLIGAVAKQKGVQIIVPEGTVIGGVTTTASPAILARGIQAATVTGILYDDANYGGGSFVATSSGTCASGSYGYTSPSPYGWNDRASSFRSYAGCSGAVFANDGYSGASYGYYVNAPSLGSLNDAASSWRMA